MYHKKTEGGNLVLLLLFRYMIWEIMFYHVPFGSASHSIFVCVPWKLMKMWLLSMVSIVSITSHTSIELARTDRKALE